MKRLKEILDRIEETGNEPHINWTQGEVSRYALEPVLQACGWDIANPRITRGAERNSLWLHDGEGKAMLCAMPRARGASIEHTMRIEGSPAIQVTTNANEWRIDTDDGVVVMIKTNEDDTTQRAKQLKRLIGQHEVTSGRAMDNLITSALERNLKPAWETLRPNDRNSKESDNESNAEVRKAVSTLMDALAKEAGARSDAGKKRTREFLIDLLWPDTSKGRRGGRRRSRLTVWVPQGEEGIAHKIDHVMVKETYSAALRIIEDQHPGTLERLAPRYPRQLAREKIELRESVRERALQIGEFWIECNLSAEEAERRLNAALEENPGSDSGWKIEVAPREDTNEE